MNRTLANTFAVLCCLFPALAGAQALPVVNLQTAETRTLTAQLMAAESTAAKAAALAAAALEATREGARALVAKRACLPSRP